MYCIFVFCMLFSQQLEKKYYDDSHMTFIKDFTNFNVFNFSPGYRPLWMQWISKSSHSYHQYMCRDSHCEGLNTVNTTWFPVEGTFITFYDSVPERLHMLAEPSLPSFKVIVLNCCSFPSGQLKIKIPPSYIYIYAFSRRFYPKRLTVHSGYTSSFFQQRCFHIVHNPFATLFRL